MHHCHAPSRARQSATLLLFAALLVAVAACPDRKRGGGPTAGPAGAAAAHPDNLADAVTGGEQPPSDSIRADVYVDATVSMTGFTAGGTSNYAKFLETLESSLSNGWRRVDIHYHKFGGREREIQHAEFLTARAPDFYAERGMNETTSIDLVTRCQRGPQIRVVITDLFQKEGDVNSVVSRIKENCLARGVAVGVLGVKSQFDGRVYDAHVPPYPYRAVGTDTAAYRAFYALAFGQPGDLDRLVQSLAQLPFVSARNFALIADHVTRGYTVTMTKARTAKDVNMSQPSGPYAFNCAVRKGGTGGTLVADVAFTLAPGAPPPRTERAELSVVRRTLAPRAAATDTAPTHDLTLKQITGREGRLRAEMELAVSGPPGTYEYRVQVQTAPVNGFLPPGFVHALSTENPTPSSDPNKTLNLEKFVMDLRQAASSVRQPVLAAWTLTVVKH